MGSVWHGQPDSRAMHPQTMKRFWTAGQSIHHAPNMEGLGEWQGKLYGNSAVETFFKTIKAELIGRRSWQTRREAELAIFQYIDGFYSPRRRHSALGWKSPVAFERKMA